MEEGALLSWAWEDEQYAVVRWDDGIPGRGNCMSQGEASGAVDHVWGGEKSELIRDA